MPVLNIKDPEVHALAVELAEHTGQTLTQAVKEALRDRLARERAAKSDQRRRIARVLELGRRASSPEQILGYDKFGVPRS
jgi:antitoxin VapB